jgi:hypothetical protein
MPRNDRRDDREGEKVAIVVRGDDSNGHSFEEQTESIDISSVGISFYLKTSIRPRSLISVQLSQSKLLGYRGQVSALVVRVETVSPDKHLVAAEIL